MLVKDFMTRHPILISSSTLATEAQRIMGENDVRHLPIAGDGKRLEGLVTRQTLRLDPQVLSSLDVWDISRHLSNLPVKSLMIPAADVITIQSHKTAERAAKMMIDHKIGCLPVIEDEDVVLGILTEVDLLHVFQQMLALPRKGVRITLRMPDEKGQFAKIAAILSKYDLGVMGIGTYPSPRAEGYYDAVLKLSDYSVDQAQAAFGGIEDFEIIDVRDVV